jgi:mannose-6-phosphate isomerase-like protein (cupin superfamily)
VRAGRARFLLGDEEVEAPTGDIAVVPPDTVRGFTNVGEGRLDLVCVHAAGRMDTEWLPERAGG